MINDTSVIMLDKEGPDYRLRASLTFQKQIEVESLVFDNNH